MTLAGSTVTYHHPDHLSNRAETNSSGTTTRTYGHFPFGETWYETGTADKWKFTNYGRDTGESLLDYASFRYYGSGLGRFGSPDRMAGHLKIPQSLNRYAYVVGDPVNSADPLGLDLYVGDDGCTYESEGDDFSTTVNLIDCGGDEGPAEGGSGGGTLGGGTPGGGGGGGIPGSGGNSNQNNNLRGQALRALLSNPDCAALFGGLQNALSALFGSQFMNYTPGMQNPDASNIPSATWQHISSYLSTNQQPAPNTNLHVAMTRYWPSSRGDIFFGPSFNNPVVPTGFSQAGEDTQMTIVMHELEHVSTQSNTPDQNIRQNYNDINKKCTPKDVPTVDVPAGGLTD